MRMTWDEWGESYGSLSFEEQASFYDEIAAAYPEQKGYDAAKAKAILSANSVDTVVEIGGWRGDLAGECTELVEHWTNYDICKWAVDNPRAEGDWYTPILLSDFPWNVDLLPADCLIMTHFIEHITKEELARLLGRHVGNYRIVHMQAPLDYEGHTWEHYVGTHILDVGWDWIDAEMAKNGFSRLGEGTYTNDAFYAPVRS